MKNKLTKLIAIGLLAMVELSTSLQARNWETIKESGYINISVRESSTLLYNSSSTDGYGMSYDLAKDFASYYNLDAKFIVTNSFGDYWKSNGEILLKNNKMATPDIYDTIDLAADIFTVKDRREELIDMHPYMDNVELFFGSHNLNIKSYQDIIGKRLLLWESMSFNSIVKNEMDKQNIPYTVTYVDYKDNRFILPVNHKVNDKVVNLYFFPANTNVSSKLVYQFIVSSYADIGINDAPSLMLEIFEKAYYRDNLRPFIPAQTKRTKLAWGSAKENKILSKKIKEFIALDNKNKNFSKRFYKYLGMNLNEYKELINMIK